MFDGVTASTGKSAVRTHAPAFMLDPAGRRAVDGTVAAVPLQPFDPTPLHRAYVGDANSVSS